MGETRPRAALNALTVSLGVTSGTLALNLLTGVLLARKLGPDGRGELTAVLLWPSLLVAVGGLGVSDALTYYAARRSDTGELVGTGVALAVIQSLVLLAAGLLIEPLVLHHYRHEATVSAYVLLAGFIPASLIATNLLGIVNGQQRLIPYQLMRGLVIVLTATGLVTLAIAHALTIRHAIFVYVGANLGTMLAVALEIRRRDGPRPTVTRSRMKSLAAFGAKSQTSNISVTLNGTLDQLLVSLFLAPRALGLYTVASTIGWTVAMVGYSVAPVALPVVAAEVDDAAARRDVARALVSITAAASALLALPLIVFAPTLTVAVFGAPYHQAATAARILLTASIVFSVNRSLEAVLKAAGRPLDAGLAETVALAVTAASLAVAIPFHSLPAVASASMIAALTSGALLVSRTRRALDLSYSDLLPTRRNLAIALSLIRLRAAYSEDDL